MSTHLNIKPSLHELEPQLAMQTILAIRANRRVSKKSYVKKEAIKKDIKASSAAGKILKTGKMTPEMARQLLAALTNG